MQITFPSKEIIFSYLNENLHVEKNDPDLVDEKITEAVADFFANTRRDYDLVEVDVDFVLNNLDKRLCVSEDKKKSFQTNLVQVLQNYILCNYSKF